MNLPTDIHEQIFAIATPQSFENCALTLFNYQAQHNSVYAQWLQHLGCNPTEVQHWQQIPCLPIQFFKTHAVHVPTSKPDKIFTSSATTSQTVSQHIVNNLSLYERSFTKGFELAYGKPSQYCILALLPGYLERSGSSLVYMAQALINASQHPNSGFFLNNLAELVELIQHLKTQAQKVLLLGVSYALMDLADTGVQLNDNFIVMETGGMKGQRQELIKSELHHYLKTRFQLRFIHSEYGMTELLSQAYLRHELGFEAPPWMRFAIREVNDALTLRHDHKTGGINVYDLANIYACPFIATQDLGQINSGGYLQLMGRFDHSDVRGCNLMID